MTNRFFGFSSESFEQFVRALGTQVFGPGLTAFGDGPDGGREATFRGEVPYPFPPATQWHGYGVVQAKYKAKPETTKADRAWAMRQLNAELQRFATSQKRSPKPDYYVFVTNVDLSSASDGGRDEAKALIQSFAPVLGLKDSDVWDANQLSNYVNSYHELRRRFKTYLTPGDLLFAMLEDAERQQPDLLRIVTTFLERELRGDESARLDQAGNRTDERLHLARLFFDLPASTQPQFSPPPEGIDDNGRLPPGILAELLRNGSRKLDAITLYELETAVAERTDCQVPARYILFGGPGSGKSTIGQFLAQIHRAALLARRPAHELDPASRQIVRETQQLCESERLAWPSTPRYPFRVELSRFAKTLRNSQREDLTGGFEAYLIAQLQGPDRIEHRDLLQLLHQLPWLLILDGLDEVPSSSNRDAVVRAIENFLAAARRAGCDLFVVASSRPRGYMREFSSDVAAWRYISPLSTTRALRYVERYALARYGTNDAKRAEDVVAQLRNSAGRTLTAQLMSSPLQVTFMATVAAARGDPGENRWQLFESYYRTIYERELQKAVPPYDRVLSRHQNLIDRLHHDVAFWLQYSSEGADGTSSSLPIEAFQRLADKYLSDEGQEDKEREGLVAVITEAARERLVFLTSRTEGELSFDVRSLQEYMAAECLMTGDTEVVRSRLRAISSTQYWRNTLQFSVSRCFVAASSRHLQDSIRSLCVDLSESSDPALSTAQVGAELALDILQDGSLAENLAYARHLCRIAFRLVDGQYLNRRWDGPLSVGRRFALAYRQELRVPFEAELNLRIGQKELERSLGAWTVLGRLASDGIEWARALAAKYWPTDTEQRHRILLAIQDHAGYSLQSWLKERLTETLPRLSERQVVLLLPMNRPGVVGDVLEALSFLRHNESSSRYYRLLFGGEPELNVLSLSATSVRSIDDDTNRAYVQLAQLKVESVASWPARCAATFVQSPNRETLAESLELCAQRDDLVESARYIRLPWPLVACLESAVCSSDLRALALAAREGKFGDTADWAAAEERWEGGISPEDLLHQASGGLPFDSSIARQGIAGVRLILGSIRHERAADQLLCALVDLAMKMPRGRMLAQILSILMQQLSTGPMPFIDPTVLRGLLERSEFDGWGITEIRRNSNRSPDIPKLDREWLEFFDWLGRRAPRIDSPHRFERGRHASELYPGKLEAAYLSDSSRLGLLRLLSRFSGIGLNMPRFPKELLDLQSFDDLKFRFAAALLLLPRLSETKYSAKAFAGELAHLLENHAERNASALLFELTESLLNAPLVQEVLVELSACIKHQGMSARIQQQVVTAVSRRPSEFQVRGPKSFGLPEVS